MPLQDLETGGLDESRDLLARMPPDFTLGHAAIVLIRVPEGPGVPDP